MVQRYSSRELNDGYLRIITRRTETTLDQMLRDRLDKVIARYSFQRQVLRGAPTVQFGTWLSQSTNLDSDDRTRINREVMEMVAVFEDWEKIISHLTDRRLTHVECRRWSVN